MEDEKLIRFIDSKYNPLFYVPDGGNVVLTYLDGGRAIRPCKYIDDYHVQVGREIYHICQFAEIMERNGTSYVPEKPVPLPQMCYGTDPESGSLIFVKRGKPGFFKCSNSAPHAEQNQMTAEQNNRRQGVTPQQAAAMLGGALHGWNSAEARVENYDLTGQRIAAETPKRRKSRGR